MSLTNPEFVASEEMLLSLNDLLYGYMPETPSDIQSSRGTIPSPSTSHTPDPLSVPPQVGAPVDDKTSLCVVFSASTSLPSPIPPPQASTLPPLNWYRIPQKAYGHGRKQWDFTPLGCITFEVNGFPGVNMADALQKRFTGLVGRDDRVLQDASSAISCRFSVRSSRLVPSLHKC